MLPLIFGVWAINLTQNFCFHKVKGRNECYTNWWCVVVDIMATAGLLKLLQQLRVVIALRHLTLIVVSQVSPLSSRNARVTYTTCEQPLQLQSWGVLPPQLPHSLPLSVCFFTKLIPNMPTLPNTPTMPTLWPALATASRETWANVPHPQTLCWLIQLCKMPAWEVLVHALSDMAEGGISGAESLVQLGLDGMEMVMVLPMVSEVTSATQMEVT